MSSSSRTGSLSVVDVRKSYGPVPVLHGVEFQVGAGERVALMGPSGSGKSTLLNCISGIEPIDAGGIWIGDDEVSAMDRRAADAFRRHAVGYIFQAFHLLPTLTAAENVELPGQLVGMEAKVRRDRVDALLGAVGLKHRARHRPNELSGGERQRVAIARALMHRPTLILADEPTGSLDSGSGAAILDLIESLSRENGTAVLLVTHDPATTRICDRTVRIQDGKVVA